MTFTGAPSVVCEPQMPGCGALTSEWRPQSRDSFLEKFDSEGEEESRSGREGTWKPGRDDGDESNCYSSLSVVMS